MALSSNTFLTSYRTPFTQKLTSVIVKSNLGDFKPNLTAQNWSIAQNHTLASSPSKHFNYLTQDPRTSVTIHAFSLFIYLLGQTQWSEILL